MPCDCTHTHETIITLSSPVANQYGRAKKPVPRDSVRLQAFVGVGSSVVGFSAQTNVAELPPCEGGFEAAPGLKEYPAR